MSDLNNGLKKFTLWYPYDIVNLDNNNEINLEDRGQRVTPRFIRYQNLEDPTGKVIGDRFVVIKRLKVNKLRNLMLAMDILDECKIYFLKIPINKSDIKIITYEKNIYNEIWKDESKLPNEHSFPKIIKVNNINPKISEFISILNYRPADLRSILYDYSRDQRYKILLDQIQSISRQLIKSVNYLHELGYIHGDLNPKNILMLSNKIKEQNDIKGIKILESTRIEIINYGSSVMVKSFHIGKIGTSAYRAPEIFVNHPWNKKIDSWAIGCILLEMFVGEEIFSNHSSKLEMLRKIKDFYGELPASLGILSLVDYPPNRPMKFCFLKLFQKSNNYMTRMFLNLIKELLNPIQEHRISLKDALIHPFIMKNFDFEDYKKNIDINQALVFNNFNAYKEPQENYK